MDKSTLRAFTVKYDSIKKQLISQNQITYCGKTIDVRSLWDTGATLTSISSDVVKKLNMVPIGKTEIRTPAGIKVVNSYMIDVKLPNNVEAKDLVVCESEISIQNFDMLVGMDIISNGDLSVSNHEHTTFTFRVPSQCESDYVRDIKIKNKIGSHGPGKRKHKRK